MVDSIVLDERWVDKCFPGWLWTSGTCHWVSLIAPLEMRRISTSSYTCIDEKYEMPDAKSRMFNEVDLFLNNVVKSGSKRNESAK